MRAGRQKPVMERLMNDLSRDPIINVVYNQIKKGISVALENECYASAVILIYSGIDAMAYLDMPDGQLGREAKRFREMGR